MAEELNTKVTTPIARLSFPALFKPQGVNGSEPKYSCVLLFEKDQDLSDLYTAAKNVLINKFGADENNWPNANSYRNPFRDQGEKEFEGYEAGAIFISCRSGNKPGVVDQQVQKIIDEAEIYAGCYVYASINFFWYDNVGKGIGIGLNNIQKVKDGDPLTGRSRPEDDFSPVAAEAKAGGAANMFNQPSNSIMD